MLVVTATLDVLVVVVPAIPVVVEVALVLDAVSLDSSAGTAEPPHAVLRTSTAEMSHRCIPATRSECPMPGDQVESRSAGMMWFGGYFGTNPTLPSFERYPTISPPSVR